jgi:hypothetical protein
MKNIKQSWKSTLIGLLLILCGLAYVFVSLYLKSEIDYKIMGIPQSLAIYLT